VHILQGMSRFFDSTLTYAGATDPGRVRGCNEDSFLVLPEAGLFAVADGLGGLDAGDIASSTALAHLHDLSFSPAAPSDGNTSSKLEAIIAAVNSRTYAHRIALGKNMATTLALVQFGSDSVLAAHVGDSRIYHWRNSMLTRVTSDHSLVNELYEQGALTASQAAHSSRRHIITRAVGAEPTVLPSIKPISIAPGDMLLLCTDGLTSMMTDEAIAACFKENTANIEQLIIQLVHHANDAGGHDNITAVVVAL
jgi:PPM family protein phosphatase